MSRMVPGWTCRRMDYALVGRSWSMEWEEKNREGSSGDGGLTLARKLIFSPNGRSRHLESLPGWKYFDLYGIHVAFVYFNTSFHYDETQGRHRGFNAPTFEPKIEGSTRLIRKTHRIKCKTWRTTPAQSARTKFQSTFFTIYLSQPGYDGQSIRIFSISFTVFDLFAPAFSFP